MELRTLQVFGQYLHQTENWSYHLVRALPNCQVLVGAERFFKGAFYDPRFDYIEFLIRPYDRPRRGFLDRALNAFICHALLPFYPRWLARQSAPVDIVHAHFGYIGWRYMAMARRLRAPLVVSFYGADYSREPYTEPIWRSRYRDLFNAAALVLCEGPHGVAEIVKLGCPPEKAAVLHLGVDTAAIAKIPRLKAPGELRLVQIANFREKKGQIYTAQAFRQALATCPNMTLTFVGRDTDHLQRGVMEALGEARARVEFLDSIDFGRLHKFLADFQLFIHPSVHAANGDCEGGAPVVLLDAQATGLPVIATRHCDIPEEVVEGRTGLLCPEKNVGALAEAIQSFYQMGPAAYQQMADNARRHVETEFDTAQSGRKLFELYGRLIGSTGGQR